MTSSAFFAGRFVGVYFLLLCLPSFSADLEAPGVPNFWKVDNQVYRGAQPTEIGFQSLAKLGVRTVIDLRVFREHSQAKEQRIVEAAGMKYVSLPMERMSTPAEGEVSRVLAILQDPTSGPVFLHCQRGADRTGALIACYRIGHDGWENKKALNEARALGMSWYQIALQRYVLSYQSTPRSTPIAVAAQ